MFSSKFIELPKPTVAELEDILSTCPIISPTRTVIVTLIRQGQGGEVTETRSLGRKSPGDISPGYYCRWKPKSRNLQILRCTSPNITKQEEYLRH